MVPIDLDTTGPDFLTDLDAAHIEGLIRAFRFDAAASPDVTWLSLTLAFAVGTGAHFFAEWLKERLLTKDSHKTRMNNIDISNNVGQITIIINNDIPTMVPTVSASVPGRPTISEPRSAIVWSRFEAFCAVWTITKVVMCTPPLPMAQI